MSASADNNFYSTGKCLKLKKMAAKFTMKRTIIPYIPNPYRPEPEPLHLYIYNFTMVIYPKAINCVYLKGFNHLQPFYY